MKTAMTFLGALAMVLATGLVASADPGNEKFELVCKIDKDGTLFSEQSKSLYDHQGAMTVDTGNMIIEMARQNQISIIATDKALKKSVVAFGAKGDSDRVSLILINEETKTQELAVECHLR